MGKITKYNTNVVKEVRKCVLEKRLNILIGSGCSSEAMPLMSEYGDIDFKDRNEKMIKDIIRLSKVSISIASDLMKDKNRNAVEKINNTQKSYKRFIDSIINILNLSNSRLVPRTANIFTTNYDLFIENAVNNLQSYSRFVFNDGASGYFERVLNSCNYNQVVAYKGINDNYIMEIPSINLIKSHGSVNWKHQDDKVIVSNMVYDNPMIVSPTGFEGQDTFINNYFHDMLRIFQIELDKPQSVLIIVGFSFQDKHIAKMVKRALRNRELIVYLFVYQGNGKNLLDNLEITDKPPNLKLILTDNIFSGEYIKSEDDLKLTLDNLSELLSNPDIQISIEDEKDVN